MSSTQHVASLRALLNTVEPDKRAAVHAFWRQVRQALNEQDLRIRELEINAARQNITTPLRPPSSLSVHQFRDEIERVIVTEAQQAEDASSTIEQICDVPPTWAMDFIRRRRRSDFENGLGCWEPYNVAAHDTGYVKINLRNTIVPGSAPPERFSVQPWGHQIAVVASGNGPLLRLTTDGRFNVSNCETATFRLWLILFRCRTSVTTHDASTQSTWW